MDEQGRKLDLLEVADLRPREYANPRDAHQRAILAAYQEAVRVSEEARAALAQAEGMAARAATALVEARKQMRRVAEGTI